MAPLLITGRYILPAQSHNAAARRYTPSASVVTRTNLQSLGISSVTSIADAVNLQRFANNPRPLSYTDLFRILVDDAG